MAVSKQVKKEMTLESVELLVKKLVTERGGTPEDWLRVVQKTQLYRDMLNPDTGLWGEGLMYIWGEFNQEMGYGS